MKYGTLQVCKEDFVFTVFITGSDLSNWKIVNDIQKDILDYVGKKYTKIEVLKNDSDFFLMILKP